MLLLLSKPLLTEKLSFWREKSHVVALKINLFLSVLPVFLSKCSNVSKSVSLSLLNLVNMFYAFSFFTAPSSCHLKPPILGLMPVSEVCPNRF